MEDVAKHPATAAQLAFKLVQHFIADEPTDAMIAPIKDAFFRSGGNLKTVALALINHPAAWARPLNKIRTPYELTVAQCRALGFRYANAEYPVVQRSLILMQHAPWEAPSPTGYSDHSLDWLNPDGMTLRVDSAWLMAGQLGKRYAGSIPSLAQKLYGPALSQATRERIAGAGAARNALTILFASPEFQRR
jgi:uncharacterized protein (DUF1800 family)